MKDNQHGAHKEARFQGRDVSLIEEEVLDTVREGEVRGSVETTPSQTSTNTEATELRQRAGTWAEIKGRFVTPQNE